MSWPVVKVGSISEQIRGVTYDKAEATKSPAPGMTPILRANCITESGLVFEDLVYVPQQRISSKQVLKPGDVVIAASSGSIDVVGKAAPLKEPFSGSFGAFCKVLRPSGKVDASYFAHFFQTQNYRRRISALAAGANINNLRNEHLDELDIPCPPLDEQRRVAAILDKAEELRAKRRAALALLGQLPQAIFLEMIGGNGETKPLAEVADLRRGPFGGALKKEIFVAFGFKVYEQGNVISGDFEAGTYYIDERHFNKMRAFEVLADDLLVTCSGTLGRVAQVPRLAAAGLINQALLRVRVKTALVRPTYLRFALQSQATQEVLAGFSRGSGLQNFPPMSEVRSLQLPVPSLGIQDAFIERIEAIQRANALSQSAVAKLDSLFANLQNSAFSGGY